MAEARYFVTSFAYLLAQWSRLWRLKDGADLHEASLVRARLALKQANLDRYGVSLPA